LEPALIPITFPGPQGPLEGLWKEAPGRRLGSAVFAHPHPRHGGTLHNKVVYRATKALTAAGYATLRFNFRGVGLSAGRFDAGLGEVDDYRSAIAEAQGRGGLPLIAGGFSFGSGVALHAIVGDPRVAAYVGVGVPVASELFRSLPRPAVPALFVVGEHDVYGPPEQLRRLLGDAGEIIEIPGADHFLAGKLPLLEEAMLRFLAELPAAVPAP
jgi:alpha/beta superfamily hydrolase